MHKKIRGWEIQFQKLPMTMPVYHFQLINNLYYIDKSMIKNCYIGDPKYELNLH